MHAADPEDQNEHPRPGGPEHHEYPGPQRIGDVYLRRKPRRHFAEQPDAPVGGPDLEVPDHHRLRVQHHAPQQPGTFAAHSFPEREPFGRGEFSVHAERRLYRSGCPDAGSGPHAPCRTRRRQQLHVYGPRDQFVGHRYLLFDRRGDRVAERAAARRSQPRGREHVQPPERKYPQLEKRLRNRRLPAENATQRGIRQMWADLRHRTCRLYDLRPPRAAAEGDGPRSGPGERPRRGVRFPRTARRARRRKLHEFQRKQSK